MTLFEETREVICDQLGVRPDEVKPEALITDDLGADSLDVVEIVVILEKTFDIEIPDEDAEKLQTMGDIVKYVESKISETRTYGTE